MIQNIIFVKIYLNFCSYFRFPEFVIKTFPPLAKLKSKKQDFLFRNGDSWKIRKLSTNARRSAGGKLRLSSGSSRIKVEAIREQHLCDLLRANNRQAKMFPRELFAHFLLRVSLQMEQAEEPMPTLQERWVHEPFRPEIDDKRFLPTSDSNMETKFNFYFFPSRQFSTS